MPAPESSNFSPQPAGQLRSRFALFFRSRISDIAAVVAGFGLIEAALWKGHDLAPWAWLAAAWIIACSLTARPSWRELGLSREGMRSALWVAGAGLLVGAGIMGGGALAGTLHLYRSRVSPAWGAFLYFAWVLGQEFILQSFFFARCERILKSGKKAVWAAGLLFFLAHLPNPVLLVAAAAGGPLLCQLFRRYRNIYPLAIAHGLVGLALAVAIPDQFHHQMKVGMAYFHWR